ncbi:MAG: VanW family protein [Patescibacteria group bacterium]
MTIPKLTLKINLKPSEPASEEKPEKKNKRWWLIILVAVFFMALIFAGGLWAFEFKYKDKIFPGVQIGDLGLSGLTKEEALDTLNQITDKIEQDGIKLIYQNEGGAILKLAPLIDIASNPDVPQEMVDFDNEATADMALGLGRGRGGQNILNQINLLWQKKSLAANFTLNKEALEKLLRQQFSDLEITGQNARPQISWRGENYQITISKEQNGTTFDYQGAMEKIKDNFKKLNNGSVQINSQNDKATIAYGEAEANKNLIEMALATTTPKFIFENKEWPMGKKGLADMLEFQRDNGAIKIGLNYKLFKEWLEKNISPDIDVEPRDAKIEMTDGKITKIIPHKSGQKIDLDKIYAEINNNLLSESGRAFEIFTQKSEPSIAVANVNDLGIKEIIGIGRSNFAGSPVNRRHNIATGAKKLNGIIIKPDEEFSLIKALGDIDASTGYLPELVIKGNKTTPEFGGGLCQIGTTIFRAALDSGLPITERRAHSYSVTYYLENGLPGVDATIYSPRPDFKFINDTGNYILIQTYIKGNDLIFEFWGTKDGRKAEKTKPKVWNWVSPPPTKIVETMDLPAGQKKCTEASHKGVDASFDYIVTYPNGEVKKTTFTSHYKPWQAVCLVGVEKLSDLNATSTAENITPVVNP